MKRIWTILILSAINTGITFSEEKAPPDQPPSELPVTLWNSPKALGDFVITTSLSDSELLKYTEDVSWKRGTPSPKEVSFVQSWSKKDGTVQGAVKVSRVCLMQKMTRKQIETEIGKPQEISPDGRKLVFLFAPSQFLRITLDKHGVATEASVTDTITFKLPPKHTDKANETHPLNLTVPGPTSALRLEPWKTMPDETVLEKVTSLENVTRAANPDAPQWSIYLTPQAATIPIKGWKADLNRPDTPLHEASLGKCLDWLCRRVPSLQYEVIDERILVGVKQHPREIQVGMPMSEVLEQKGNHFRFFYGPRSGHDAMIYDDVTVHIENRMAEYASGTVREIEKTSPHIAEWVKNTPYEDNKEKPLNQ